MYTRAAITPVGVAVDVLPNAARTFFEGAVFITHLRVTIFLHGVGTRPPKRGISDWGRRYRATSVGNGDLRHQSIAAEGQQALLDIGQHGRRSF